MYICELVSFDPAVTIYIKIFFSFKICNVTYLLLQIFTQWHTDWAFFRQTFWDVLCWCFVSGNTREWHLLSWEHRQLPWDLTELTVMFGSCRWVRSVHSSLKTWTLSVNSPLVACSWTTLIETCSFFLPSVDKSFKSAWTAFNKVSKYENFLCVTAVSAFRNMNGATQPERTDYTLYQHQVCFQSAEVNVEEKQKKRV